MSSRERMRRRRHRINLVILVRGRGSRSREKKNLASFRIRRGDCWRAPTRSRITVYLLSLPARRCFHHSASSCRGCRATPRHTKPRRAEPLRAAPPVTGVDRKYFRGVSFFLFPSYLLQRVSFVRENPRASTTRNRELPGHSLCLKLGE